MKVRDYRLDDRAACLTAFDSNIPRFFSLEEREAFGRFLDALPDGRYAVICNDEGAVVGCGGLAPSRDNPRVAVLTWGLVDSSLHGKGYGKALTEGRLAWLADMPAIELVRIDTSHLTLEFYTRRGFRLVQRLKDFYQPGLDRCDMELVVRR